MAGSSRTNAEREESVAIVDAANNITTTLSITERVARVAVVVEIYSQLVRKLLLSTSLM